MTGDYPHTPAEVIVSGSSGADDTMTSCLDQFLKNEDHTGKPLVAHAVAARQWLEDNGVPPTVAVPQSAAKSKAKKKHRSVESDHTVGAPKRKMRTASDVIKRIQWQKELNPEDFTVGYLDRFLGVQEKQFEAFSWEDIATVDDYAVLAIPKHRIQYFKYRGTLIWDKPSRLDNVFGSTGSGITLSSFVAGSNALVVQDQSGQQAEADVCMPDRDEESSDVEHSDDEDDGVVVTIASSDQKESLPYSKLERAVMPPLPQRQPNQRRPNYFVCQRITSPSIVAGVKEVQEKIVKVMPAFSSCFVDPASLHITFCTLALNNDSQVRRSLSTYRKSSDRSPRLLSVQMNQTPRPVCGARRLSGAWLLSQHVNFVLPVFCSKIINQCAPTPVFCLFSRFSES